MKDKKSQQLGINISTAQGQLTKDILWMLLQETSRTKCFVCNEEMTRDTFSIEHKESWLDKENAKELFFNLNNISFSHLSCNISRARKGTKAKHGTFSRYCYGCRCNLCKQSAAEQKRKQYSSEKRRKKYLEKGY